MKEPSVRVQKFVEALSEEGLISLTENGNPRKLHGCMYVLIMKMYYFKVRL